MGATPLGPLSWRMTMKMKFPDFRLPRAISSKLHLWFLISINILVMSCATTSTTTRVPAPSAGAPRVFRKSYGSDDRAGVQRRPIYLSLRFRSSRRDLYVYGSLRSCFNRPHHQVVLKSERSVASSKTIKLWLNSHPRKILGSWNRLLARFGR